MSLPRALTIAGSDPSGGAGIQADLKVFSAFRVHGMAVLTALTVQNTRGVRDVQPVSPDVVAAQLEALLEDLPPQAIKTGMLARARIVSVVAKALESLKIPLVVDPVLASSEGVPLLEEKGLGVLKRELLPLATLITPNLEEAARLTGLRSIRNLEEMKEAAVLLEALGPRYVLIKGGHLKGEPLDLLFDAEEFEPFEGVRRGDRSPHGTGCALSAAIAAGLAQGMPMREAVGQAKRFLDQAIRGAMKAGKGREILDFRS